MRVDRLGRFMIMTQNDEQTGHPWASSSALGFIALAVSLFSVSPILVGWVNAGSFPLTAAWSIVALIALVIVTVLFLKNRDMLLGTVFGVLGILLAGGLAFKAVQITMLVSSSTTIPQAIISGGSVIDAMVWVIIGAILVPVGYLAGYLSKPFAVFVWLADVGVWLLVAANFGVAGRNIEIVGGYLIFVLGVWFLYMGIAQLVNGTLNRTVIKTGEPLFKSPEPTGDV